MSLYESLLVEGRDCNLAIMQELGQHIRLRKDLNLDTFLLKMAENAHLPES